MDEIKKIIILGTASTLSITPWDLSGVTYWACSPVITHKQHEGHRIDAIFEMHKSEYWISIIDRLNNYIKKNSNCIIYMQDENKQITNCIKYPLTEVQSYLNHPRLRKYLTSTIAYMVILAIIQGFNSIEMYGVHMSSDEEEYSLQRPCLEALLAFGFGRGIDFWLPDESDIMKCSYLYGYEQEKGVLLKAIQFEKGLGTGEKELERKLKLMNDEYNQQKGGRMALEKFIQTLRKSGV